MSDAPDGPDETRGGKGAGDPALEGATETGGSSVLNRPTGGPDDNTSTELPGQKGGTAAGGSG